MSSSKFDIQCKSYVFLLLLLLARPPGKDAYKILLPEKYTALQGDLVLRLIPNELPDKTNSNQAINVTSHSKPPNSSLKTVLQSTKSSLSFNNLKDTVFTNDIYSKDSTVSVQSPNTKHSNLSPLRLAVYAEHSPDPLHIFTVKGIEQPFIVPCGVVVHGGNHFARLEKDGEVIYYSDMLNVTWPKMMIVTPSRLETYHSPADFMFRFISSQCLPHSPSQFNVWVELLFNSSTAIRPSSVVPSQSYTSSIAINYIEPQVTEPSLHEKVKKEFVGFYKQSNLEKKRQLVLNDTSSSNSLVYSTLSRRARAMLTSTIPSKYPRMEKLKVSTWDKSPELFVMQSILLKGGLYSKAEHNVRFGCDVIGPAADYSVRLVSDIHSSPLVAQSKTFKVEWSEDFKLYVPRKFLFPCFSTVLVSSTAPECVGGQEKIRLYAILRANVTSTNPPLIERYITERRAQNGKTTAFECTLFKDEPTEYCFVYVNSAKSGAVSNVRRKCIATFKPSVLRINGNWSGWSEWTECTTTCGSGIRIRYRLCNSPPPRNGGFFCVGPMLHTKKCHLEDCVIDVPQGIPSSVMPPLVDGKSHTCQCGCHISLDDGLNLTLSATAAECDGASSWVIEGPPGTIILLDICRAALLPGFQWLKIRDGNTTASPLLLSLPSTLGRSSSGILPKATGIVLSSSELLLIDFRSDVNASFLGSVWGFCVNVRASSRNVDKAYVFAAVTTPRQETLLAVHIAVMILGVTILFAILGYTTYYCHNYTNYKTHVVQLDESPLVTPCSSPTQDIQMVPLNHTASMSTLTEVLSMKSLKFGTNKLSFSSYSKVPNANKLKNTILSTSGISLPSSPMLRKLDIPILRRSSSNLIKAIRRGSRTLKLKNRKSASFDHLGEREISPIKEDMVNSISMHPLPQSTKSTEITLNKDKSMPNENQGENCKTKYGEYRKSILIEPETICKGNEVKYNPKSSKDRLNLEKLRRDAMSRASSEKTVKASSSVSDMSVNGTEMEMEYDYYDYDVGNASAIPGSLFGMDPTIMPWDLDVEDLDIKTTSDIVHMRDKNDSPYTTESEDNTARSSLYSPAGENEKGDPRQLRSFNFPSIVDPLQESLISNDSNSDGGRTDLEDDKTPLVENVSFLRTALDVSNLQKINKEEPEDKILNILCSDDFQFADDSTEEEDEII